MCKSLGLMLGTTMTKFIESNMDIPIDAILSGCEETERQSINIPSVIIEPSVMLPWCAGGIEDGTLQYIRLSVYPAIDEDEIHIMELVWQIIRLMHDADIDLEECVIIDMRLESAIFRTISDDGTGPANGPRTGVAELTFAVFLIGD